MKREVKGGVHRQRFWHFSLSCPGSAGIDDFEEGLNSPSKSKMGVIFTRLLDRVTGGKQEQRILM